MQRRRNAIATTMLGIWGALGAHLHEAAAGDVAPALYSSTDITLHYGKGYVLGKNGFDETARSTLTLEHYTGGPVGDVYFYTDIWRDFDGPTTGREVDQYGEIYGFLSGKNLGIELPADGFIRDVGVIAGLNIGTDFGATLIGPRVDFNVPGFDVFSARLYYLDTWRDPLGRELDDTYQATIVWGAPIEIGSQRFYTQGFASYVPAKGQGVEEQLVIAPQFRWDVGHALGRVDNNLFWGVEYSYSKSKYGVVGADENALTTFVSVKF